MQKMTVTVDGKKVEVPAGSTILDAANAAGSRVPTLCHDNKLHPFGACRLCLVEVEGAPPPRPPPLPPTTSPPPAGAARFGGGGGGGPPPRSPPPAPPRAPGGWGRDGVN